MSHLMPGLYKYSFDFRYASIAVVVVALLLRGLGELLLPARVRLGGVDLWEDEVEDLGVPRYRLAFDAFFDVL